MSIKPRTKVPTLSLPMVGGGQFELAQSAPKTFTLLVVYRGLHCPICKTYLRDLDRKLAEFEALGVKPVAASTDIQERAEQSKAEWGIEHLPIAYGLGIEQARTWGLFISAGIKERRAATVRRARPVPDPAGPDSLCGLHPNDAVRPAVLLGRARRGEVRDGEGLPRPRRGIGSRKGETCSWAPPLSCDDA